MSQPKEEPDLLELYKIAQRQKQEKINETKQLQIQKNKKLKLGKTKETRYKASYGLNKKLVSLAMAILTAGSGMGVTAAAVEKYQHDNERLIAIVQDIGDDKFESAAPIKIDYKDRKKFDSSELVDKKYYEISSDSIVFVQENKIKPGDKKNDVIIYTEDGIVEGKMEGKYLEIAKYQLTKESKEKFTRTYKVISETGANLRSTPEYDSNDNNKIMEICPGEIVLATDFEHKDKDGKDWVDILYLYKDGISYGYVSKDLLKSMDIESEKQQVETEKEKEVMKVDTGSGIGLNCRSSAEIIENNIIEKIPSGVEVYLTGNNKVDEKRTWVQIEYENEDGDIIKGWVDSSYLKEVDYSKEQNSYYTPSITSRELKKIISSVQLNDDGRVTGIDSLGIKTNQIENLNNNGITENVIKSDIFKGQKIDISEMNGHVNFVYLRIGGMGYGKEFRELENEQLKDQVKKCEELGIPYGFYYYSTSTTKSEANIEYENIIEEFEDLGDLKYNLLPFAIDVELGGNGDITKDRQYGNDVTNAKAHLTNKLKDNFGLDVMLYTSGNCTLSTTKDANILDLEEYHRLTGVENVWMPMPKQQSGEVGDRYKEYLQKFPKCMNLIMEQEVLDTTISNGAKIDIDTISKEEYINLLYRVLEKVQEKENGIEYER